MRLNEYERAILGSVLIDPGMIDECVLLPEDFTQKENRSLFAVLQQMRVDHKPIDLVTVAQEIDKEIVPVHYLAGLPELSGNFEFYVREILRVSVARRLKKLPLLIEDALKIGDAYEAIEIIDKYIHEHGDRKENNIFEVKNLLTPAINRIEAAYSRKPGTMSGITTGFTGLDLSTDGFQNGDLIFVGARPSIGKTAILLHMAKSAAQAGHVGGIFSLEMDKNSLMNRIIAAAGKMELLAIRSGKMRTSDFHDLLNGAEQINKMNLLIDDTPNMHIRDLKASARKMHRMGARILYVDYLTLIRDSNRGMPKHERVGEITKDLRQIARELKIPVVVASQLNRDAEGKKPSLAELRASGSVEEDGDVVILLHRDRKGDDFFVMLEKQRNGPVDEFQVNFHKPSASFSDF